MSSISAGTTLTTALVATGDTSGQLELQANGATKLTVSSTGVSITGGIASPLVVTGNSTSGAELRLPEDTDNGSNYVALKAADSITSNVTFTLPAADGTSGQVLQTNGSGTLSFASPVSLATPLAVIGNATAGSEIRLPEDTDNGSNYVALKAADNIASNVTFTLPSADGTNGQVLQTNGSGTLSFATPAGGSWTYLSTVTASNSATMDIETTFSSTYDSYAIVVNDIIPATDNDSFWIRLKINGSYQTASYGYIVNRQSSASGTFDVTRSAQAASRIISAENVGNAAGETISGIMYVFVPASTTAFKSVYGTWTQVTSAGNAAQNLFTGYYSGSNATAALTGVRLMFENGNITSGTARLYGIKNS